MKTNLFIAALSLVVLAGCSSEDEIGTLVAKSDNAINFGTYVGKQTKAPVTSNSLPTNSSFGVFAYYTGQSGWEAVKTTITPNFMYNQKVDYNGTTYTYSPLKYWPNTSGDQITFLAYYPHDDSEISFVESTDGTTKYSNASQGLPKATFTVTKTTDQTDFMYSEVLTDKTSTDGKISFTFKHALAQVNIQAKMKEVLNDNTTVQIKSVSLKNILSSNTFTFGTNIWGTAETATSYNTSVSDATPIEITKTDGVNAKNITSGESTFLMVPQTLPTTVGSEAQIEIKYDVITTDASLAGGKSTITNTVPLIISSLSLSIWGANKKYLYTLEISLSGVEVAATVENWSTEEEAK